MGEPNELTRVLKNEIGKQKRDMDVSIEVRVMQCKDLTHRYWF